MTARMRHARGAALLAALILTSAVAHAQVATVSELTYPPLPAFSLPKPSRTVLPNGLVLLVMEDHELPLVTVSARIRTGGLLEPAEKTGLAGLTGSLMRSGGTTALPPDALDRFLEDRAASIETGIGDDSGTAGMSVLTQDFAEVLRVFSDVLRHPRFDQGRLEVAKRGIEASIARQNDDPGGIAAREFRRLIYGADSPFARTPTYASVQSITRDDLVAWHARDVHPEQTILAVHGDITTADAVAAVRRVFGDWARGPKRTVTFPEPRRESPTGVYQAVKADVAQSSIRIGHQGTLKSTDPDYYAVQVLNEVLSGSFTSRLFSRVRTERGLAYSVGGAVASNFTRVAPFSMTTSTKTSTTGETIETLIAEARRIISDPPTAEEIARAKQSILNSFVFNSATTEQVLAQQVTYEYYGLPRDWLERYRAGIEKVTAADLARVARQYIRPDSLAILVVGPTEGLDRPLDTFGAVKTLDISIPEPPSPAPAPSSGAAPVPGEAPAAGAAEGGRALVDKAVTAMGGAALIDGIRTYREENSATLTTAAGGHRDRLHADRVAPGPGAAGDGHAHGRHDAGDRGRHRHRAGPAGRTAAAGGAAHADAPAGAALPDFPAPAADRRGIRGRQCRRGQGRRRRGDAGPRDHRRGDGDAGYRPGDRPAPQRACTRRRSHRGPADVLTQFGDYRPVDGVTLPHERTNSIGGTTSQRVTVKKVQINPAIAADLFAAPAVR